MKLEIFVNGEWVSVTHSIFRSWAGKRKRNGKSYSGPVYIQNREQIMLNLFSLLDSLKQRAYSGPVYLLFTKQRVK